MEDIPTWRLQYPRIIVRNCSGNILVFLLLCILIGCSPKTTSTTLPIDTPEAFSYSGNVEPPDRWWTAFEDQRLNALVDTALESNFNLLSVWYRFEEAQAVVDRESSFLLPDVEASLQSGLSHPEPNFVGGENFRIGLSATYEVDLWGRIHSNIEAERYRAEATLWDYQAAAISLSAEITRTWYQLLAAWDQLELAEAQIENNEKILQLIKARFGSGLIRGVDILRQKQLLEATREQKIFMESQIQVLEHQLAVLLGVPPQEQINYARDSLPNLPPLPETGIPTELVERRPDVQRAFNFLRAADREVASAISNQYPRLTINGSVSQRANSFQDLYQNWAYSLGANLVAPLFYGGRLSAEVDRTQAVKNQLLYEYGQSVLVAFREVEDALIQEQKQQESIQVLKEQVQLVRQTSEQLRIQYFNGMSNYLDVLTVIDQEQQLQRDLVSAKMTLLEYRIALYRALAGGFEVPERRRPDEDFNEGG